MPRVDLIESGADRYWFTRRVARAIHAADASLQGLLWVSRQDDSACAVVLFGDRIAAGVLQPAAPSVPLTRDPDTYGRVLAFAVRIGVSIVPGKDNPRARAKPTAGAQ